MDEAEPAQAEGGDDAKEEARGGGGGGKAKKKKNRRDGAGEADVPRADDADADSIDLGAMSMALPSPELVALQTRQAFESTDEYKRLNKTQRRKAMQQWEAENEHLMEQLRKEGKEPTTEATSREKKPEQPARKEKVHGSGAHSREIKTPKTKKKAVYGKPKSAGEEVDLD